jgi:hypothetical protein
MKLLLPIATLVIAGTVLAACGTTRENRFNETTYADHNGPNRTYDHEVVYRSHGHDDPDVVYVQPAYRVVPVARERVIYYYD